MTHPDAVPAYATTGHPGADARLGQTFRRDRLHCMLADYRRLGDGMISLCRDAASLMEVRLSARLLAPPPPRPAPVAPYVTLYSNGMSASFA